MTYLKKNHKEVRAECLHFAIPLQTLHPMGDSVLDFFNKKLVLMIHCQTGTGPGFSLEVEYLYRFTLPLSLFPMGEKKIMFSRPVRVTRAVFG